MSTIIAVFLLGFICGLGVGLSLGLLTFLIRNKTKEVKKMSYEEIALLSCLFWSALFSSDLIPSTLREELYKKLGVLEDG